MIGQSDPQELLFLPGTLVELIPDDYILKRVHGILDLSWLRDEVAECYDAHGGRPSIPPDSALKLMLAGFFLGIVHDRKLLREAEVNIAIRWFAGYRLGDRLPDHSALTKIRQRWGVERFKRIFLQVVKACIDAGLVSGETVHVDGTLIRADVSWHSVAVQYAEQSLVENTTNDESPKPPPISRTGKPKKRSRTDPDASLATSSAGQAMEPCFKQFTAVDSQAGVIVDVALATGEADEGTQVFPQLERIAETTGRQLETLTADCRLGIASVYAECERRQIAAIIPPLRQSRRKFERIPACRFRYDPVSRMVTCPCKQRLYPYGRNAQGWIFRGVPPICGACPCRSRCIPENARVRAIVITDGYEALLRARRQHALGWDRDTRRTIHRHRGLVEGVHGEAKTQHGLRRAVRRGLENVSIQVYLTAIVINLKRLASAANNQISLRKAQWRGYWLRITDNIAVLKAINSFDNWKSTEYWKAA
jgi:transposase